MFADQAGTITKDKLRRQQRRTERTRQDAGHLVRIVKALKYCKRDGQPLRRISQGGCGGPADCLVWISG